jgi:RecA-family ATPase
MGKCVWENELVELPPLRWLIENVMPLGDIGMFFGPTQSFKSFLALDIACHVARDKTWSGHAVCGGTVIYVAGEAQAALERRNFAWRQAHKAAPANLGFWMEPVQIWHEDSVAEFMTGIDEQCRSQNVASPCLIIFDTYHKCMAGKDEDDAGDAGLAFNNLERIKEMYNCTILLIHHPGRKGNHPRGSSCIDTDVDFLYQVTANKEKNLITLTKQKLRAEVGEEQLFLTTEKVPLPDGKSSLILQPSSKRVAKQIEGEELQDQQDALELIREAFGTNTWSNADGLQITSIPKSSWHRNLDRWQDEGKITKVAYGQYALSA